MASSQRAKRNVLSAELNSPNTSNNVVSTADLARVIESNLGELKKYFKAELKLHEERVMEKFGGLSAEVANLRADIKSLSEKYKSLSMRCDNFNTEIMENKLLLSAIESQLVAADVIINNVPNTVEVDVAMQKITSSLACGELKVVKAFRAQSKDPKLSDPIIAKLSVADDRVTLFRSLASFRRAKKRQLQLANIGIDSNMSINIYECLSTYNRQLLNTALDYKKKKTSYFCFLAERACLCASAR